MARKPTSPKGPNPDIVKKAAGKLPDKKAPKLEREFASEAMNYRKQALKDQGAKAPKPAKKKAK